MNRLFVGAALVILIVALVFINQGVKKSGTPDHDEDAPPPRSAPVAQKPAIKVLGMASTAADLPAEQRVGNPAAARHKIVVGWSYNAANQQKPETLAVPLKAIRDYAQQSGSSVVIVNTDVPVSDRSPGAQVVTKNGVFVDGKPVISGDLSTKPAQEIVGAVLAASK